MKLNNKLNSSLKDAENRPLFISITGNIGSGKTLIANFFKANGYHVYSADTISKEILDKDESIKDLKEIFGDKIISKNKIDTKKLRNLVFKNKKNLKTLNDYMHKRILHRLQVILDDYCTTQPNQECSYHNENNIQSSYLINIRDDVDVIDKNNNKKPIFFEIPLLYECNLEHCFDFNILIVAEDHILIDRVVERDNCTHEQVISILENQIDQSVKMKKTDIVLLNNSNIEYLEIQLVLVIQFLNYIKKKNIRRLTE
ncbi:MAG: dephospho-CoA kinase [Candidatus Cloacimonetes bacterium]|nr:dephospho-CoA kinase [Candidatus Cloacimonadota bacterium]